MNKYNAKHVFWNTVNQCVTPVELANSLRSGKQKRLPKYITRFDSQHEFRVYLELIRMYGVERIDTQVPVEIIPPSNCFPSGKKWKVDFGIKDEGFLGIYDHYVEAKGLITREFVYTLGCLEQIDPYAFFDTYLVFTDKIPLKNKIVKNLWKSKAVNNLMTLKQLKTINKLP